MADVTMVQGYGFPRGGRMDYAGYAGYGAAPIQQPLFDKISQLDGYRLAAYRAGFGAYRPRYAGPEESITFTDDEAGTITADPMYGPVPPPAASSNPWPMLLGAAIIGVLLWR